MTNYDGEANASDRRCPHCGKEAGEVVNCREWVFGATRKWMNELKCKSCGREWTRKAEERAVISEDE